MIYSNIMVLLPEIFLAVLALSVQTLGVFTKSSRAASYLALLGIVGVIFAMTIHNSDYVAFGGSYTSDEYTSLFKLLVLGVTTLVIMTYIGHTKNQQSEYLTLILLSSLGSCIAISARDLILLFVGLELAALSGYMLACFKRDSIKSSEAGLKYFVLGALASCLILLGMSFLYGFSGSTSYVVLAQITEQETINIGIIVGGMLLLSGLMFKMSAAPFHFWTPDVYEGAPIISVSFFASSQKLGVLAVLIVMLVYIQPSNEFSIALRVAAILSMLVGSIGALIQESIKRLMAYSTILNVGFAFIPLVTFGENGWVISMTYLVIYAISTIGLFALLGLALGDKADDGQLKDLSGLSSEHKILAAFISILIFSMIGLPPMAGFFGKYYVLYNAVENKEYLLAAAGLLSSLIAAYYYLRIIKAIYFEESTSKEKIAAINPMTSIVAIITLGFTLLFWAVS
jgi:NADH-quinone oxidoreductase subunit N